MNHQQLKTHLEQRDLLCVHRAAIDENTFQGVLLAFSDSLLLFQNVYDFHLDGYRIVRRGDITELRCSNTDRFQRELLQAEGVFDQIDFGFRAPIPSYDSFLASRPIDEIVIVEDERSDPPAFLIGTVSFIDDGIVHVNHFDTAGRGTEAPESLSIGRITSCQIATRYTRVYERHFARKRLLTVKREQL